MTYRFGKRQATYGTFEFAQSQDDHRRQTHRIPHSNVGLDKNNNVNYTLLAVIPNLDEFDKNIFEYTI